LIIGFQDTVENVGDVFLGHSVQVSARRLSTVFSEHQKRQNSGHFPIS